MSKKQSPQKGLEKILTSAPVVPVIVIDQLEKAVPLAKALQAGGLNVLEITLRTPVAQEAIKAIIAGVKDVYVGAGTVITPDQLREVEKLGCAFAVCPGFTKDLLKAAKNCDVPLLPGAVTPSESLALLEKGYQFQKFFPAEAVGGAAYLASLNSPLPQVKFCPTGGITLEKAPSYLKLANVITIGGSWMLPKNLIEANDWAAITALAKAAASLKGKSN